MKKIKMFFVLYIINHFLSTTRFYNAKNCLLRSLGLKIGKNVRIVGPFYFNRGSKIEIGENTFIGLNFSVRGNGNLSIGKNCDIAPEVSVLTGTHSIGNSSHRAGEGRTENVIIEEGVWVGARATVFPGVTVKKGCIVGACSAVNKDTQEDILVAGVPAKEIRKLEK